MKIRLDVALVEDGYFISREKSKANIMAGNVILNGQPEYKSGTMIDTLKDKIEVKENILPYVSRGGLKLEKALKVFGLNLKNKICMDVGASTGGFTDCMLQNGAKKVYAIDVGYGQLDYKLRIDERVVNLERTNFRNMDSELIMDKIEFASVDVSFISLKLIFPKLKELLSEDFNVITLIKPQFEAGKEEVGKNGIIKDKNIHKKVIENTVQIAIKNKIYPVGLTFSPIKGQKGNIEFLMSYTNKEESVIDENIINEIVESASTELSKKSEE